ncbi:hypothetical protein pb186bvf_018690 [Paramecium bursaria]
MQQLEQRLQILENLIGNGDLEIVDTLYTNLLKLREIVVNSNIESKINRLTQIVVNFEQNFSAEALTNENKIRIISMAEEQLKQSQLHLEKILNLKKYVDFEPIILLKEKIADILLLQTTSRAQNIKNQLLEEEYNKFQQQLENLVRLSKLRIVLGSSSKNRKLLLEELEFFQFTVFTSNFEENLSHNQDPKIYNQLTCKGKVDDVLQRIHNDWDLIIFADTICEIDGKIIEKPGSSEEAAQFLRLFSGRSHLVHSTVYVAANKNPVELKHVQVTTKVHIKQLSEEAIQAYVKLEHLWKGQAGGYKAQGSSIALIEGIEGDYTNVVGLPISQTMDLISSFIA